MTFFTANLILILLVLGFCTSLFIAWMAYRAAVQRPIARWLIPMMLGTAVWSAADILIITLPDFEQKRMALPFVYVGVALVLWSLPLFTLEYTGLRRYTNRQWVLLLAIEPLVMLLLVMTNDAHRLFWLRTEPFQIGDIYQVSNTYGPLFWLHTAYAYVVLLGSTAFLLRVLLQAHEQQRTLSWLVIIGVMMPWIGNIFFLSRLIPVDLTSLSFAITGFSLSTGIVRYRLFDLTPIARDAVIEVMNDAVLILDNNFRLVDLNKAAWRVFTPPQNPGGLELSRLSPELAALIDPQNLDRTVHRTLQIGGNHYEMRFSPLRYASRWSVGWMILLHDVTLARQAQAAIKAERDFALQVMSNMGQGLSITDQNDTFIYVNPAYERITGYRSADLVGASPLKIMLPEDRPAVIEAFARRHRGESSSYIGRIQRADNTIAEVLITGAPRLKDGVYDGGVVVITDLTEQRRAEVELRQAQSAVQDERDFALQVMNNMGQGLTVTDKDNRFIYVNPAYGRITGYRPEEVLGKTPLDLTYDADLDILAEARAKRQRGQSSTYENRFIRADGSIAYGLITGVPRFRDGEYDGAIAVITDLTEQKRTEEELRQARDEAMEASRMKSVFLATMSHELRTPLTAIMGYAELQLAGMTGPMNDEQRDYTDRILVNSKHLLTIINQVLDISKIEAGRMDLAVRAFQPCHLVEEVLRQTASLVGDKPIHLQGDCVDLTEELFGDPDRLKQILLNLVSNAIKFTEKGQINIRLARTGKDEWQITVRDSGIGIPGEALPYIFDEFRQVDSSNTRTHEGTGLGLTIVRKLVRLMGGEVQVTSEVGTGSLFTVSLPLRKTPP